MQLVFVSPASLPVCLQLEISIKEELIASLQKDLAASRAESVEEVKVCA